MTIISSPPSFLRADVTIYFLALENGILESTSYSLRILSDFSSPMDFRMAHSVGLPRGRPLFDQLAVELMAPIISIISLSSSFTSLSTTVILFWVSVPVLSVNITFTAPTVSQACIFFTRLFSLAIVFIEKAKANVTDSGRPSGTATMITTIALIRNASSLVSVAMVHSKW